MKIEKLSNIQQEYSRKLIDFWNNLMQETCARYPDLEVQHALQIAMASQVDLFRGIFVALTENAGVEVNLIGLAEETCKILKKIAIEVGKPH